MQEDIFDQPGPRQTMPLAARMRPQSIIDVLGQSHLTAPGRPLARLLDPSNSGNSNSIILWGPPGSGKTTLASLAASVTKRDFREISAVSAGVAELRKLLQEAREQLNLYGRGTILFIDEVHRFSKTQQDALLPAVENGWITLIAATTENPSFSVISPLLSRSLLLTLNPLDDNAISILIERAVRDRNGLNATVEVDSEAMTLILRYADGDARRALTALEACAQGALGEETGTLLQNKTAENEEQVPLITAELVQASVLRIGARYDRDGDQHYDVISAFIKSIRGSDVDAALHYLARMLLAGEDPRFIARRLVVHSSEDIGLADPTALHAAVAAAQTVALVGMPEARLALAQATIHLALAPKSNAVLTSLTKAISDIESGRVGQVPKHLRDAHYSGAARLGHGNSYKFPHDYPGAVVEQQYLPDLLQGHDYYTPTTQGRESALSERYKRLRAFLRGESTNIQEDSSSAYKTEVSSAQDKTGSSSPKDI